jgi:hypothetical protein
MSVAAVTICDRFTASDTQSFTPLYKTLEEATHMASNRCCLKRHLPKKLSKASTAILIHPRTKRTFHHLPLPPFPPAIK